ncbi:MAG TPA: type II toxin-antitoxin system death-on-curing family toxin [bacterium]|jgi:death-on-curing family protein|nr:type II toxin-antitoxin system death-on-curing family toxin [bacterium]
MKYLTAEQLRTVNQRMIRATGGLYLAGEQNVVYPPSLDSLVNFVQTRIALRPQPTVWDLAAFYLDRLIRDQIFHDGNKRTALEATRLFLESAGYRLALTPAAETVEFITGVAKGGMTRDGIAVWLRGHAKRKSNGKK